MNPAIRSRQRIDACGQPTECLERRRSTEISAQRTTGIVDDLLGRATEHSNRDRRMIGRYQRAVRRARDNTVRKSKEVPPCGFERQRVDNLSRNGVESSQSLLTGVARDEHDFSAATDADSIGGKEAKTGGALEHDAVCRTLARGFEVFAARWLVRTGQRSTDDEQGDVSHSEVE